ncbi:hypothetical protein FOL47_005048, partial [Perkinsus chesapeaki]
MCVDASAWHIAWGSELTASNLHRQAWQRGESLVDWCLDKGVRILNDDESLPTFESERDGAWPRWELVDDLCGSDHRLLYVEVDSQDTAKVIDGASRIPSDTPDCVEVRLQVLKDNWCVQFTKALENGVYPDGWKSSKGISIHKAGRDPTKPNGWRPICLVGSGSKLFERAIVERLASCPQIRERLDSPIVHGFCKSKSVDSAVLRVVQGRQRKEETRTHCTCAIGRAERVLDETESVGISVGEEDELTSRTISWADETES